MKKFLLALMVFALHADPSAAARARFQLEGEIKVRFYYDQAFYSTGFWNYNNLPVDLMNALNHTGTYSLGLKFAQDTSPYNSLVDMGSKTIWSEREANTWLVNNLPLQAGVVKVLVHKRAITPDGTCGADNASSNSYYQGVTYRALPTGGKAQSHMMLTAKSGCSSSSSSLVPQLELKSTFVHEMGHALAHPGNYFGWKECTTPPLGSIMCHGVAVSKGVTRSWQKWFPSDITLIRTEVFDTSAKQYPAVQCYEYSSYAQCDNECINTAGFPNIGATEVYENCKRTYCSKICK